MDQHQLERGADYIVAGAGSAGCVLARRLAQSGATVILLEAGGPDRTQLVRKPGMIAIMPSITGGNTNAPAMMIGEHCAALMRAAAKP